MKSLHIRDVDPWVLQRLRRRAELHHRSMQGELRAILEEAARRTPESDTIDPNEIITVSVAERGPWNREDIYDDNAR
ncbi:MAG: Arc family DNA-binding protein [Spirochaetia bacterium]